MYKIVFLEKQNLEYFMKYCNCYVKEFKTKFLTAYNRFQNFVGSK